MNLSVITATRQRPAQLVHCLEQFRRQSFGQVSCEHIVVSDGPDRVARHLAERYAARYFELSEARGHAGAFAKDLGIREAAGEYVCFWDDDNLFEPHALTTIFAAVHGADLGVVRVRHRLRKNVGIITIPRWWSGTPGFGDIDTMCVAVRRTLALKEPWGNEVPPPGTDYRWLKRLGTHNPRVRYVPIVIGMHL